MSRKSRSSTGKSGCEKSTEKMRRKKTRTAMKIVKSSKLTNHPDFSAMSDERLNQFQDPLQTEIDDIDNPLEKAHLEIRMQLLQAERKKRVKGKTAPQTTIALQDFALHGLPG